MIGLGTAIKPITHGIKQAYAKMGRVAGDFADNTACAAINQLNDDTLDAKRLSRRQLLDSLYYLRMRVQEQEYELTDLYNQLNTNLYYQTGIFRVEAAEIQNVQINGLYEEADGLINRLIHTCYLGRNVMSDYLTAPKGAQADTKVMLEHAFYQVIRPASRRIIQYLQIKHYRDGWTNNLGIGWPELNGEDLRCLNWAVAVNLDQPTTWLYSEP